MQLISVTRSNKILSAYLTLNHVRFATFEQKQNPFTFNKLLTKIKSDIIKSDIFIYIILFMYFTKYNQANNKFYHTNLLF